MAKKSSNKNVSATTDKGTGNSFKFYTIEEILEKGIKPEAAESAYRRGYRDGFIAALYATKGSHITLFKWAMDGELCEWMERGWADDAEWELPPAAPRR